MGAAVCIDAHILELLDSKILKRVGDGAAHSGVVLVVVGSVEFDIFIVEEEALLGVEAEGADSERGFVSVNYFLVLGDFGH